MKTDLRTLLATQPSIACIFQNSVALNVFSILKLHFLLSVTWSEARGPPIPIPIHAVHGEIIGFIDSKVRSKDWKGFKASRSA